MSNTGNSVKRAAKKIGVSERTGWNLIKDKKLETIKVGGRTLVTDRQIESFLSQCESNVA